MRDNLVAREHRGRAFGLFHFAIGLGALPASLLMGWLWQKFGPAIAFQTGAAIALTAACALMLAVPKRGNLERRNGER